MKTKKIVEEQVRVPTTKELRSWVYDHVVVLYRYDLNGNMKNEPYAIVFESRKISQCMVYLDELQTKDFVGVRDAIIGMVWGWY
jgi:hypothetical protein